MTSGVPSTDRVVATTWSAQHTRPKPPPMAAPSTRHTSSWGRALRACSRSPNPRFMASSGSVCPSCRGWPIRLAKPPKLPPAQKAPPAPVSTTMRSVASCAARPQACSKLSTTASLSALRVAGSFIVQVSTAPWRSINKVLLIFGAAWQCPSSWTRCPTSLRLRPRQSRPDGHRGTCARPCFPR